MGKIPDNSSSPDELTFMELLQRGRNGDQAALGELLQSCRDYLLLVANQDLDERLRAKMGASDVVQETLFTAQDAFDQFEGASREEMLAWMRAILKNDLLTAHRHYNTKKRQTTKESPIGSKEFGFCDQEITPGSRAVADEETRIVKAAMQKLSDEHRTVLDLRNWQEKSFAEIGHVMNRSDEAARKLWSRAVLSLKKTLGEIE